MTEEWTPEYSPWRHGGWYVDNVRYPGGAVGCVSRNYPDKKWRVVCNTLGGAVFPNRDAAARAERAYTLYLEAITCPEKQQEPCHGASLGWRCELPIGHTGKHGEK
jgi:hypothetical protein